MNELREILGSEIDALRDKKTTAANVNAVVNATGKILTTVKMEIEYAKIMGRRPLMPFIELEDEKPVKKSNKREIGADKTDYPNRSKAFPQVA